MFVRSVLTMAAITSAASVAAQQGNTMIYLPTPSPAEAAAAAAAGPVLKAGTEVPLALSGSAKSRKFGVGQRVPLTVSADVRLGTTVVIPAGATAEGEVTAIEGKGVVAKPLYVRVNDKLVRLAGSFGAAGARATLGEDLAISQ